MKYGMREGALSIRLLRFLERISFQFADRVITIDKPVEDLLVSRGLVRSKSTIIMNSAEEIRFSRTSNGSPIRVQQSRPRFVMMYHGTLTPIYGLDIAIQAFPLVPHEMPEAEFWILGSGTEQKVLAKQAEELGLTTKVKLLGHIAAPRLGSVNATWEFCLIEETCSSSWHFQIDCQNSSLRVNP